MPEMDRAFASWGRVNSKAEPKKSSLVSRSEPLQRTHCLLSLLLLLYGKCLFYLHISLSSSCVDARPIVTKPTSLLWV